MFKKLTYTLGQIYRSWLTAVESVVINKLRTALSLSGITIGIFSIITVFTLVDSMEIQIRNSINSMGSNTLYVGTWPWDGGGEWWKYYNRPQVSLNEYNEIRPLLPQAQTVAFVTSFSRTVRNGSLYVDNVPILGATYDYNQVRQSDIDRGRYFTPFESEHGTRVAIIGTTVAENLFGEEDPLGKDINIAGIKLTVIGVFDKAGDDVMGMGMDRNILIPINLARNFVNLRWAGTDMIIKGPDGGDVHDLKAEARAIMRRLRRLSPQAEDNFAINEIDILNNQMDDDFRKINFAGGIIGIFAILVGGFGVANIMFVSVKERTSQIGIQKALGARPYFILFEFIFEAVILSVVGGAIGLLLIFCGVLIVNQTSDFTIVLTFGNIVLGLAISSTVGAVAGFFPAWSAARMEPVKAIYHS